MIGKRLFVTGGAGFIGCNLVDKIISENEVIVFDNLSTGVKERLSKYFENKNFQFIYGDLLKDTINLSDIDVVIHLAANPDVKIGAENTEIHFQQNVVATYNLLEAMRKYDVKHIIFTSSSTVYGDATLIPTPENYAPLIPISLYGASKLASEGLIIGYANTFDFSVAIYRFANVIGKYCHGVIRDFINKLRKNPKELIILGDGTQTKSYCYITDCIDALLYGYEKTKTQIEIFNIGSEDYISVMQIAEIVSNALSVTPKYKFTSVRDGRGWIGDVKVMLLKIEKLKSLGYKPKYNSYQSVKLTVEDILAEL